ncbi:MAG: hypothetical protein ACJ77E_04650 [Gaiellaceae bacterium]
MSWDVLLQKFERGAEATFDHGAARALLGRTSGFRQLEPGVGELEGDGYAEVYYGAEPSSDVMVAVRVGAPGVIDLVYRLAAELRMAVFFPTETDWGVAVLDQAQVDDLPDSSWHGWESFGDGFTPPTPIVCEDAAELGAALQSSYNGWQAWAHRSATLDEGDDLDDAGTDRRSNGLIDLGASIARRLRDRLTKGW